MTTLRVVLDSIVSPVPGGIGRYTEELTRALIESAPSNCEVAGIVSSSPEEDYDKLEMLLPGLASLFKSNLGRAQLATAWRCGVTGLPGRGMVHSTSLLAPLRKHDRLQEVGNQTVVTVHDVVPWSHPESIDPKRAAWFRAMAKRAHRFADAVVVPTHAVADQLGEIHDFGDRIRVIGGAVSSKLTLPVDADARAKALELPERYILSVGTLEPRKGLAELIRSLVDPRLAALPLLVVGETGWRALDVEACATDAGVDVDRVLSLGFLADADLAVVMDRATVFAFPSLAEGFGLSVIEAFNFGTPVVHSDAPAVLEVAAGAGLAVAREDAAGYPSRLAEAIASVVNDSALAERLKYLGLDRAGAFSWHDSAEKIWQLHADL